MESHTVLRAVVARWPVLALAAVLSLIAPRAAMAQFEITGSWAALATEELSNFSTAVDYMALPLSDEGRTRALSYSESQLSMIERQCQGWPPWHLINRPSGLKIWSDFEPARGTVVSYTIGAWSDRVPTVIWMDGRPHPSTIAEHTRGGFTTGRWEADTLVAVTTHLKAGAIRRNGAPSSDRAVMTSRFFRHGNILTMLVIVDDPIYLAEPLVLTKSFEVTTRPLESVGPPCLTAFEGRRPSDPVPHYIPEKNPFVGELTKQYGLPREVVLGFPETLYPEYRQTLRQRRAKAAQQDDRR